MMLVSFLKVLLLQELLNIPSSVPSFRNFATLKDILQAGTKLMPPDMMTWNKNMLKQT
jgi:hypothetical protein